MGSFFGKAPSANTTTTTQVQPPSYLEPYLSQIAKTGQTLYSGTPGTPATPGYWSGGTSSRQPGENGHTITTPRVWHPGTAATPGTPATPPTTPQYYPGQQIAPFTPFQTQAQNMDANMANNNPLASAATNYETGMLSGKYLGNNPYLNQVVGSVENSVMPAVESQFAKSGDYGGSAMGGELTKQLTDALAPYQFQNYQNTLALMNQNAGYAPNTNSMNAANIGLLSGAGNQQQLLNQSNIEANMNKWQYNQMLPYTMLDLYKNTINPMNNATSSSVIAPYYTNPAAGLLGAGMLGLGLSGGMGGLLGGGAAAGGAAAGGGLAGAGGLLGGAAASGSLGSLFGGASGLALAGLAA